VSAVSREQAENGLLLGLLLGGLTRRCGDAENGDDEQRTTDRRGFSRTPSRTTLLYGMPHFEERYRLAVRSVDPWQSEVTSL
jgi:hypothetical protein